jgi:SHS2 domain-containing protein
MTLDTIRIELDKIIRKIPEFAKSTRGDWLYNAKDSRNEKVKVQFKGNNFKIMVGQYDTIVKSVPLNQVKVDKVEQYVKWFLVRGE